MSRPAEALPSDSSSEEDVKKYYLSQALLDALMAKGFSENAVKKSIAAGCVDEGTCTQWISMHAGHPELDTPLSDGVEVIVRARRVLTDTEREAKVRELRDLARAKAEAERQAAFEEDRRRAVMSRRALDTREALDQVRRESEELAARRQREADAAARRRVTIQIAADRLARGGLSAEEAKRVAEAEFDAAAQRRRDEPRAPPTATATAAAATPTPDAAAVQKAFGEKVPTAAETSQLVAAIRQHADTEAARESAALLRTILTNIRQNPFDTSKRTLRTSTRAFGVKLSAVPPALQLLRVCGFQLATDSNGGEIITATAIVMRTIDNAIEMLQ